MGSFINSYNNLVPLSIISIHNEEVRFIDGMTRMFWFVGNRAEIIPV